MKKLLLIVLCLNFVGCATAPEKQVKPFVDPQYGMTKLQMLSLEGKPDSIEIFKQTNDVRVEFYIYHRQHQSLQEKVPICLIDQKIVGWGTAFYEDHVSQDDIRIK